MRKNEILSNLRNEINKLEKRQHVEILRLLTKNKVHYSENRNGIFVNMILLDEDIISELDSYIKYIKKQEKQLNKIEKEKKIYKDTFFNTTNGV
jgi:hypothetical protein